MKLIAIASCPTGIAHSQMTAEDLLQAGRRPGHDIGVEAQGAMGTQDELVSDVTAEADAVIITSDTSVSRDRFNGKLVLKGTVKDSVNNVETVVQKAIELAEVDKTGSIIFGSSNDGEGADIGADDSSDDANAAESDKPVRRGGDPEEGPFARLKKLFS